MLLNKPKRKINDRKIEDFKVCTYASTQFVIMTLTNLIKIEAF